jgi:hypothetical protein
MCHVSSGDSVYLRSADVSTIAAQRHSTHQQSRVAANGFSASSGYIFRRLARSARTAERGMRRPSSPSDSTVRGVDTPALRVAAARCVKPALWMATLITPSVVGCRSRQVSVRGASKTRAHREHVKAGLEV